MAKGPKVGFQEVSRREGDYALVGIAAWFDLDATSSISACGLSAIGAADTPVRLTKSEAALLGSVPSLPLLKKPQRRSQRILIRSMMCMQVLFIGARLLPLSPFVR